jgi:hypothetical protein
MPTQLTIPVRPQFGVGTFEPYNTFHGLAGLRWSWESSFGVLLPTLGEAFTGIGPTGGIAVLPPTGAGINLWTHASQNALSNITKGMTNTQHAAATHYVQRAFVLDGIGASIDRIAADLLDTKKDAARRTRPQKIIQYIRPTVRANLKPLQKAVAGAEARARKAEHENEQLRTRVQRLEHAIAKPEPIPWPGIPGRIGDLERWRGRAEGGLKRLAKFGSLAYLLALLAKVLEKMGVNYIRCSKSKRFGKAICGMNDSWLNSLLSDALLFLSLVSIVDFAKELQTIEAEVVKGIRLGVKELKPGFKPVSGKMH